MVRQRHRWSPRLVLVAAAALTLTLAGCSEDAEPQPVASPTESGTVFVGTVDASSANIGLVTKGDQLAGMVCEDENASLRLDAVTLENGIAELMQDGKVVGTVSVADDIAVGTVDFDGSKRKFQAEPATGDAGIYRMKAEKSGDPWDGWVVLNDGSYTGTRQGEPSAGSPWVDPQLAP